MSIRFSDPSATVSSDLRHKRLRIREHRLARLERLNETTKDLMALKTTIEQYGLTKSLLAFVNTNDQLSKYIPEIPSLEYLQDDINSGDCTQIVVAIESWLDKLLTRTKKEETVIKKSNSYFVLTLEKIHEEDRIFSDSLAKLHMVSLPSYNEYLSALNAIVQLDKILTELFREELPKTKDTYTRWRTSFVSKTASLEKKMQAVEDISTKKSMYALGYTRVEIISEFEKRFQDIMNVMHTDNFEKSEEQLESEDHNDFERYAVIDLHQLCDAYTSIAYTLEEHCANVVDAIFACTKPQPK